MPSEPDQASVAEAKRALRKRLRALRLVADQKEGPDAALAVIRHVLPRVSELGLGTGAVAAGYWPILTEIDVRPLLARLDERGVTCALPCIEDGRPELVFRRWRPTEDLVAGVHDTRQPDPSAPEVVPRVLFVPMLAVDRDGHRLGYGRGWYDRTLGALRRCGRPVAIAIGFGVQLWDRVPFAEGDAPVDWILTERALERVRG